MSDVIGELLGNLIDEGIRDAIGDPADRIAKRPRLPMPDDVREALTSRDLMAAYEARAPYQRNDYLGWIARAKEPEIRQNRLATMLKEVASASGYMGQPYDAKRSRWAHRLNADKR